MDSEWHPVCQLALSLRCIRHGKQCCWLVFNCRDTLVPQGGVLHALCFSPATAAERPPFQPGKQ